jgi:hypothetical protein
LHASTALYGNIHALAESPLRSGLLAAGTDDGLIQISRDGGRNWQKHDSFPGVPAMMKVGMLAWSQAREATLFAVFDGHQDNDFRPHVVRSDDHGANWTNITADLPAFGPTKSIAVHPRNGELLFVGTDFGVHVSRDGGGHWLALQAGLPTNSVQGIMVHPRDNDLVIGTHGRGFWVLDQLSLLEALTPAVTGSHSYLAQPRRGTQIRNVERGRKNFGNSYFTTANPPRGAFIDYWIGDTAVGQPVRVELLDKAGTIVRTLPAAKAERGAQRLVWDLRFEPPPAAGAASWRKPAGRFVVPGTYTVRLTVGDQVHNRPLDVRLDPAMVISPADRTRLEELLVRQERLLHTVAAADTAVAASVSQTNAVVKALTDAKADAALVAEAQAVHDEARRLAVVLHGEEAGLAQQETFLALAELTQRLYATTEEYTAAPDPAQQDLTRVAEAGVTALERDLAPLLTTRLPALKAAAAKAGVAWPAEQLPALPAATRIAVRP